MFFFNRKKNKEVEQVEEIDQKQTTSEEIVEKEDVEAHEKLEQETETQAVQEERELGGFALFKDQFFDMEVVRNNIKRMTGLEIEVVEDAAHPTFLLKTEEGTFLCQHMAQKLTEQQLTKDIAINAIEPQTLNDIKESQSFAVISRVKAPYKDRVKACVVFTKIASALMIQPNAAAMYLSDIHYILSPQRYYAFMGQIMQSESDGNFFFPYPLWIKTNLFHKGSSYKAVTLGLSEFGLHELGFEETKRSPEEIFNILMGLSEMYLVEKCRFQDGDAMKLDQNTEATFKLVDNTLYIVEE